MADPLNQLPYFREYVEQILRPRVARLVEDLRTHLSDQVWSELLEKLAADQAPQGKPDRATLEKLRSLMTDTLGLRLSVQLNAEFAGVAVPAGADVVDRTLPNNPLARAVSGVRRA